MTSIQPVGPLLAEPTGLGLVTVDDRDKLQLTDLDTGLSTQYSVSGTPKAQLDEHLVVQSDTGHLVLMDLSDPQARGTRLGAMRGGYQELVSVDADLLWVLHQSPANDQPVIAAYNTSGDLVDEYASDSDAQADSGGGSVELIQDAGGVYEREGSSSQLVVNGSLLISSDELALVKQCDERMTCESAWYSRSDWSAPLDAPAPALDPQSQMAIIGGDRWLIHTSWTDGATDVVDIATGRVARTLNTPPDQGVSFSVPISPDGRWLLDRTAGTVLMVDLDDDVEYELDLGDASRSGSPAVFVDLGDLGRTADDG